MWGHDLVVWAYLTNATLLCVHEIDSAYWHEWSLFGIPGGIQLFLTLARAAPGPGARRLPPGRVVAEGGESLVSVVQMIAVFAAPGTEVRMGA
jgi:hypothetical protein